MISVRPLELAFVDEDAEMELAAWQVSSSIRTSQLRFWRITWRVDQSSFGTVMGFWVSNLVER